MAPGQLSFFEKYFPLSWICVEDLCVAVHARGVLVLRSEIGLGANEVQDRISMEKEMIQRIFKIEAAKKYGGPDGKTEILRAQKGKHFVRRNAK